jgi:hypothetical protein
MQLIASFVEYLVIGCIALFWAVPVASPHLSKFFAGHDKLIVLLLPSVYVLGMAIDFMAEILLSPVKDIIRRQQERDGILQDARDLKIPSSSAFVFLKCSDLGKEVQARNTRDRIARGTFLNLVLATILFMFVEPTLYSKSRSGVIITCAVGAVVAFPMWWRFEKLSRRFRHNAVATIIWDQEHSKEECPKSGK